MIEDIIKITTNNQTESRLRQKKYYNRHSKIGGQADDDVMYCTKCDRCWEYRKKGNGNKEKTRILHYNDFVTYGKERIICRMCKNKK